MVVLYTNIYLLKLWTVYEVAAFLAMRENVAQTMKVVPVSMVGLVLAACTVTYMVSAASALLILINIKSEFIVPIGVVCAFTYLRGVRTWHRDKRLTQERINKFEVRNCICAVESDRDVVYTNIAALIRAFGFTKTTASLEEALDAFNELVRRETPAAFKSAFGLCAFEFYHYFWLGFQLCGPLVCDHIATLGFSWRFELHAAGAAVSLHWLFCLWPIFALAEIMMGWKLHLTGYKEILWVVAVQWSLAVPVVAYLQLSLMAMEASEDSTFIYAVVLSVGFVSTIFGSILLYRIGGLSMMKGSGWRKAPSKRPASFTTVMPSCATPEAGVPGVPGLNGIAMSAEIAEPAMRAEIPGTEIDADSDEEFFDFYI
mmetsp:Transcript_90359/g.188968  ORF Transcript_90359/g.188968 Transcript_90359/m.188968 type:complete len:372 (-) Transcript_90359:341-1456(-)